jgi:NACalpha-BTF3-like transcription factor
MAMEPSSRSTAENYTKTEGNASNSSPVNRSERGQTERDIARLSEAGTETDVSADEAQVARLLQAASEDLPKFRLSEKTRRRLEAQAERRKQLAAVRVADTDIAQLATAICVSKSEAERLIRETNGDLLAAMRAVIRWELPAGREREASS